MKDKGGILGFGILGSREKMERCHKTQAPPHLRFIESQWKDKFAEALAKEIVAKGHFDRRDYDELENKIRKMLDQYQKDWG